MGVMDTTYLVLVNDTTNAASDSGTSDADRSLDNTGMPFANWDVDEGDNTFIIQYTKAELK